jgi:hypothetical protein
MGVSLLATAIGRSLRKRAIRVFAASLLISDAIANSAPPPLPPRRPAHLNSSLAPENPRMDRPAEANLAGEARERCLARLNALGVDDELLMPQEDGDCVVASPVRLYGLAASRNASGAISFQEKPLIDCRLAERLADWLREAVSPLFRANLGPRREPLPPAWAMNAARATGTLAPN